MVWCSWVCITCSVSATFRRRGNRCWRRRWATRSLASLRSGSSSRCPALSNGAAIGGGEGEIVTTAPNDDRRRIAVRVGVLQGGVIVCFAALAICFWVLQVVQTDKFVEMANSNYQRTLALRAPRGVLYDRNGRVLVENRNSYTISIDR